MSEEVWKGRGKNISSGQNTGRHIILSGKLRLWSEINEGDASRCIGIHHWRGYVLRVHGCCSEDGVILAPNSSACWTNGGGLSRWTLVTMETLVGPRLLGANYCTISSGSRIYWKKWTLSTEHGHVLYEDKQTLQRKNYKTTGISINVAAVFISTPYIGSRLLSAEQLSNLLRVWLQATV